MLPFNTNRISINPNFHLTGAHKVVNDNDEKFITRATVCAVMDPRKRTIYVRIQLGQLIPIPVKAEDRGMMFTEEELRMGYVELRHLIDKQKLRNLLDIYGSENIHVMWNEFGKELVLSVPHRRHDRTGLFTPKGFHLKIRRTLGIRTTLVL